MNIECFGMDTISLAGPLEARLQAMRQAGFGQVMLKANDLTGHPGGVEAAVRAVRDSGLRGTGFQVSGLAQAITPGDEGQCVRIRTESGRVLCGRPSGNRQVEVAL